MGGARILIADDELRIRTVACRILKHLGHDPVAVADANQMVELFRRDPGFELVVLDLGMPGPEGPEALRALRHIRGDARVVVSTGLSLPEVEARFPEMTPDSYLQKPYSIRDVQTMLDTVFRAS